MSTPSHFKMLAEYNGWMNAKLYETAAKLERAELERDRGAFFGSIIGTLNHLVVTDTMWLKRFAAHPAHPPALEPVRALPTPTALSQILFTDLRELGSRRKLIDAAITDWTASLTQADLDHVLVMRTARASGRRSACRGW